MDSVHMPTGCGTWPAFWMNGPTWPQTGEIDIVEGVNNYTNNQATLHTGSGCQMPSTNAAALNITGNVVGGTNCAALQTGNEGCGIRASQTNSFGAPFNSAGGGVYASAFCNFFYIYPRTRFRRGAGINLVHWQCCGTIRVSPFGSLPGEASRPISLRRPQFLMVGAHPWRSGQRALVIRTSFSRTRV